MYKLAEILTFAESNKHVSDRNDRPKFRKFLTPVSEGDCGALASEFLPPPPASLISIHFIVAVKLIRVSVFKEPPMLARDLYL